MTYSLQEYFKGQRVNAIPLSIPIYVISGKLQCHSLIAPARANLLIAMAGSETPRLWFCGQTIAETLMLDITHYRS